LKIEPQAIVEQNVTMFAVLIRLDNRGGLLRPGMNAEVSIEVAERKDVTAVPTAALRAYSDIPATAVMLGIPETQLRNMMGAGEDERTVGNGRGGNGRVGNGSGGSGFAGATSAPGVQPPPGGAPRGSTMPAGLLGQADGGQRFGGVSQYQ